MPTPVALRFDRVLPTHDPAMAWAAFSDTDRFNRDAGLGFTFSDQQGPDGRPIRLGEVRRLGLLLRWEEEPFQLDPPRTLISGRRFVSGPLARLTATITLTPTDAGIALTYLVALHPRHALLRPIVALDAALSIRPTLARTIAATAERLRGAPPLAPARPDTARAFAGLPLADRLARHVDHADARDVDRMRPLALARAWAEPEADVIEALLRAADRGALQLRFDLLCPGCQGPKLRLSELDLTAARPHCPSCRIAYDGALPDGVEVTFRPAPSLREVRAPLDCVNSPAHTPHVVARARLEPGEERRMELDLEPGAYALGTLEPSQGAAAIEARDGLRATEASVEIGEAGLAPSVLRVAAGPVGLWVRNRTAHPAYAQLERRWRPPDALSLGRVLEHPAAAPLIARAALPAPTHLRRIAGAFITVDGAPDAAALVDALADPGATFDAAGAPSWTFSADGVSLLAFADLPDALRAALRLRGPDVSVLLDAGEVALLDDGHTGAPTGPLADRMLARVRRVGRGRVAVSVEHADDRDLADARFALDLPLMRPDGAGFALVATAPLPPPDTRPDAGRWTVGDEIARGGMGVVYAGTDPDTGAQVAIKVLLPELAADPSAVQRLYHEGWLAARLDHPNAVRVLDVGARGLAAYLVMERLIGEELGARLAARRRLPVHEALRLTLPVLDALHAAHRLGIVHRDVKPANIFLAAAAGAETPKVIDFGIAIDVSDDLDPRAATLGTPRYLAPEQVERRRLDPRVDVYAVGLVLYELLSGDVPFTGATAIQVALSRLGVDPAPLIDVAPDVPRAVNDAVMRALAVEPDDRWPSAAAMAAALREATGSGRAVPIEPA